MEWEENCNFQKLQHFWGFQATENYKNNSCIVIVTWIGCTFWNEVFFVTHIIVEIIKLNSGEWLLCNVCLGSFVNKRSHKRIDPDKFHIYVQFKYSIGLYRHKPDKCMPLLTANHYLNMPLKISYFSESLIYASHSSYTAYSLEMKISIN